MFIISRKSHVNPALSLITTHFADERTETWVKSLVQGPLPNRGRTRPGNQVFCPQTLHS